MKCFFCVLLPLIITLTSCTTQLVKPAEFGGHLTSYEQLNVTTAADGTETLRWVSPKFTYSNYSKAHFDEVVFHPKPKVTEQIGNTVLSDLQIYTGQKLKSVAKKLGILTNSKGSKVVSVRMAITGVKTTNESFKPWEVIPFKLVMAGAGAAIGFRDQDLTVYFEIIGEDSLSQAPLFTIVLKINGDQLDSKWDQMELKHIQKAFDKFSEKGIAALAKHLSQ
ncbi:MAG: hypothetical protein COA99_16330 [Moraxellaceae bacterium]|nr:MAG: hypothetical protein COA99_16330 [Moraxellaceae bacterium]